MQVELEMRESTPSGLQVALTLLAAVIAAAVLALSGAGSGAVPAAAAPAAAAPAPAHVSKDLAALAAERPSAPVEVIAQLDRGASFAAARAHVERLGGTPGRSVRLINALSADLPAAAAERLATLPGIKAVTLNAAVATRAKPAKKLETAYNQSIGSPALWEPPRKYSGRGVGVAVVDTGIAGDLPDFRVSRTNTLSRVRVSAVVNPDAKDARDHYGHGTHVAGLIAGNGRALDIKDDDRHQYTGVAPGAKLVSIKASDDEGRATVLDVIYGIQFAVDHKDAYDIRVLNLSLSSTTPDSYVNDPLNAAVEAAWLKGIFVVAAAGNFGADPDATSYSPGNDPYVLTVGAVDDQGTPDVSDDKLAPWSSRGKTRDGFVKPEVLAPGAQMISTLAPGSDFAKLCPECIVDGDYFQAGGTSMAAAVASGAAALLFEAKPEWTPDEMKAALIASARNVPGVGVEIAVDDAVKEITDPAKAKQSHPNHPYVDPVTGDIDHDVAKWRAAKWRTLDPVDPAAAKWSSASFGCADCTAPDASEIDDADPAAAKWRAAKWRTATSWRTSFTK